MLGRTFTCYFLRRRLAAAARILSRDDLYQSRIEGPKKASSSNRSAETISPTVIALLPMRYRRMRQTPGQSFFRHLPASLGAGTNRNFRLRPRSFRPGFFTPKTALPFLTNSCLQVKQVGVLRDCSDARSTGAEGLLRQEIFEVSSIYTAAPADPRNSSVCATKSPGY